MTGRVNEGGTRGLRLRSLALRKNVIVMLSLRCHSERSEGSAVCSLTADSAKHLQNLLEDKQMPILRSAQDDRTGDSFRSLLGLRDPLALLSVALHSPTGNRSQQSGIMIFRL